MCGAKRKPLYLIGLCLPLVAISYDYRHFIVVKLIILYFATVNRSPVTIQLLLAVSYSNRREPKAAMESGYGFLVGNLHDHIIKHYSAYMHKRKI